MRRYYRAESTNYTVKQTMTNSRIVVVGGGTAGLTVSAQLLKECPSLQVTIIEPSDKHYYQPLWTLVGAGIFPRDEFGTQRGRLYTHRGRMGP